MKKLLFIYNLHAGKGQLKAHLSDVLDELTKAGWLVCVHPTQGPADATAAAKALGGAFDRVVCAGGDGTLHEVVTGLMTQDCRPPIGYIPAGSTNDFARNLALPRSYRDMAAAAGAGVPRPVDVGRFNDRYFLYVAAFGAFTDVSYDTPQSLKNMFGHLAYVLEGVTRLASLQSYHLTVEHDGGALEGEYLFGMVCNTISVGGFQGPSSDEVRLDDGLFEVVLIKQPSNAGELQSIIRCLLQMGPDESGAVTCLRTGNLRLSGDQPIPWTLDGEYGGDPRRVEIENCCHGVTIVYGK